MDDWRRWFAPGVTFFWVDEAGAGGGLVAVVADGDNHHADLVSMWVRPDMRGKGVGDALVAAVVAWAHERGRALRLYVVEDNAPALTLYARHGFHPTGEVDLHADGVRELEMTHNAS